MRISLKIVYKYVINWKVDVKNIIDVSIIYVPLKFLLKEIDVSEPKKSSIYNLMSERLKNKDISLHFSSFESLMVVILHNTRKRYHDIEPSLICNKFYFDAIYQLLELFPQSNLILSEVLRYAHCYLEGHIKYPLKLAIKYLIDNLYPDLVLNNELLI